jgi:hypothetical protein
MTYRRLLAAIAAGACIALHAPFARTAESAAVNDADRAGVTPAPSSSAARPEVELHWAAPSDCPAGSQVVAEVNRLATNGNEHVRADAKVWKDDALWHVALVTMHDGQRGERILDAETCALAADATSFVLAMMLDPEGVRARLAAVDASSATPTSAEAPTGPLPAKDAPSPAKGAGSAPRADRFGLSLLLAVDSSVLPSVAPGFGAAASARVFPSRLRGADRLRVRLEVAGLVFPSREASASVLGRGGDLRLWTVALRAIPSFTVGAIELGGSVGGETGSLDGDGFGVKNVGRATSLWTALLAGGLLRWPATGTFGLRAQAELVVPVTRSEFQIDAETVHVTPAVSARGTVGAEVYF